MSLFSQGKDSTQTKIPFHFELTRNLSLFFQSPIKETNLICPIWDPGAWQLQKLDGNLIEQDSAKELQMFAGAIQTFQKIVLESPGYSSSCQYLGIAVTTPLQVKMAAQLATHLFIPGEFCRQGDLLAAAAASDAWVLIERGPFLAANDMLRAAEKLNPGKVLFVDAGSSFGYSDRVLDVRALVMLKQTGLPFGVNLSAVSAPQGEESPWKGTWLSDVENQSLFLDALVESSLAVGASFFISRSEETNVRRKLERVRHGLAENQQK